jgi:hypothetical protein
MLADGSRLYVFHRSRREIRLAEQVVFQRGVMADGGAALCLLGVRMAEP